MPTNRKRSRLRSQLWFDNPENPGMTAIYLERYLNCGLTREELTSGKPMIGIARSESDLSPCNRHHLALAERVREGVGNTRRHCVRVSYCPYRKCHPAGEGRRIG